MGLVYNGTTIGTVVYNGTTIDTVIYNGTTIYTSTPPQTDDPSISAGLFVINQWQIRVTNNDGSTAVIRAEADDSTPDVNRGSVGSGAYVDVFVSKPSFATFSFYATAQATGESLSNVVSRTIT